MPWETVKRSSSSPFSSGSGSDSRKSRSEIDDATEKNQDVFKLIKKCHEHPEMNLLSRLLVDMGNIDTMDMADLGDEAPDLPEGDDPTPYDYVEKWETWEQWTGLLQKAKDKLEVWRNKLDDKIGELDKGPSDGDSGSDGSPYDSARIHRTIMTFNHCAQLIMCLQQSMASIARTHQATFYNSRHHGQVKKAGEQAFYEAIRLYYYLNHKD